MVKRIGRRFVSLLLTFVTILTMLPAMTLPALAAGGDLNLTDSNIGLHYSGDTDNSWSAQDMTISGTITCKSSTCTESQTSTLTICNKSGKKATLSFDYKIELNGGSITIAGKSIDQNGSFSQTLENEASINVQIKSSEEKDKTTTIKMTNVNLVTEQGLTVTFQPAENGSYTVDGEQITKDLNYNRSSTSPYPVKAIPNEGYQFLGWYDVSNGTYLPGKANDDIYVSLNNSKVTAIFKEKGTTFQEESSNLKWDDLNDAIISASNNDSGQITLLKSCAISGEYTIPSGVTLLIPFDEAGTLYTTAPEYTKKDEPQKAYRTLTMAPGSSITVDGGAISVGGKHLAGSAGSCCKTTGQYGQIIMQEDSSITLHNGANLYAWGYITGDGQITADSEATVYEYFQVMDWRGGNAVGNLIGNNEKVFPFSQYYVQNIEAPLTIQYGATEKAYFNVIAGDKPFPTTIDFIGTKGLFKLDSGSITKKYVPATGRTEYTTNGSAYLEHLAVTMTLGFTYTIDSKDYALPINGNMTLNIASGKVTSNYDLCLLPGVQINIAKGAELEILKDADLYVYDSAEWGTYCYQQKKLLDVNYSPTLNRYKRTELDLVPAKIDVNGTLTAAGRIYTTQSGANICSSEGTGKYVQQGAPGQEKTTHQVKKQASSAIFGSTEYYKIPITAARLHNADDTYTETATAIAGQTIPYCTCLTCGKGKWLKDFAEIVKNDGTRTNYPTLQKAVTEFPQDSNGNTYIKLLHSTTENITADRNLYLDLNGCTVTGDFKMGNNTLYGMDSSVEGYNAPPKGKIVGSVVPYAKTTYQTPPTENKEYDRYVAISGQEADGTANLSFHRFNISVTGYRFELAAPKCALFFIGKFQGDEAAKDYLTSLGITLKDNIDGTTKNFSCAKSEFFSKGAQGENSTVDISKDGAYLFEAYLMHDIDKENYQTPFSAIAHATFKNSGNSEDNSLSSVERNLSFKEAWKDALKGSGMIQKDKDILTKFLNDNDLNISNP